MQNEKPHITLPNSAPSKELYRFGANGNLRLYSYDRLFFALYGYDGGTTRTYKYSFDLNPNWVNGHLESVNFNLHNAMFYPNSYLNFNSNGYYTKHYYNGMERIASRLGEQSLLISTHDPELQDRKDWQDSLIRKNIVEITGYDFLEPGEEQTLEDPKPVFELPQVGMTGLQPIGGGDVFYYHPNHLGSTCYVTDGNASVQQGFLYAPFGEITNEHNVGWQNGTLPKYSFNAKELDEETGMYYYEARYYAPPVFTSRDPLFEKYPTFTPYAYCANNPVKYVDPTGEDLDIPDINQPSHTQSKNDILSLLVNKKNIKNVNIEDNGKVTLKITKITNRMYLDKGFMLLYDLIKSDKNFYYEASDIISAGIVSEDEGTMDDIKHGIINASDNGLDSDNKHTHVPKQGYNGHVILAKSGIWYDNDGRFARPSVLFHELAENYYRTHFGIDYMDKEENHNNGAHSRASFREGLAYKNPDPGCFDNRSKHGSYYYKGKRIW